MNPSNVDELRVLVLAPIGRDAELSLLILKKAGISGLPCRNMADVQLGMQEGAGAALIAEESFTPESIRTLSSALDQQPAWADFPFIVVSTGRQTGDMSRDRYSVLKRLGNVSLLERPIHPETLTAALETALRARRRQYAARDSLIELETARGRIEELNRDLEQKVIERTQALAESQQALNQAQKLEAIGQLAGGIAHDFNNLLTGILGVAEDLRGSFKPEQSQSEDLDSVIKACNRAFAMTRQLLAFGRRQVVQPKVLDMNLVVREVSKLLTRLIGEHIELVHELNATKPICADAGHLEQVVMNLAVNSRDAMPKGGQLIIASRDERIRDPHSRKPDLPVGDYVVLSVRDSGSGMTDEILKHIFEPFFTTKGKDRGTGLGLATVYGIVKQSGGDIVVDSILGKGTTFHIYFPAVNASSEVVGEPAMPMDLAGQEVLLVVEDEELVRQVICKKLRQQGYTVLEARDGQEALEIGKRMEGAVDLILTDVVMPVLNGFDLVQRYHEHAPQTAVLFMSGYPADVSSFRGVIGPGIEFVEKSALADSLLPRVRQILNQRRSRNEVESRSLPS